MIPPNLLFRFAVRCSYLPSVDDWEKMELPSQCALPCFGELEDRPSFADVRVGWHETGLAISVNVSGKSQALWCRESRPVDSDGLTLLLATRDVQDVHRANRFCHRFVFLPAGAGARGDRPFAGLVAIDRCRENPKVPPDRAIRIKSKKRVGGYSMGIFLPGSALTGYEPSDFPSLGFSYAIADRELGWQTFTVGTDLPFMADPTLWATLELQQTGG